MSADPTSIRVRPGSALEGLTQDCEGTFTDRMHEIAERYELLLNHKLADIPASEVVRMWEDRGASRDHLALSKQNDVLAKEARRLRSVAIRLSAVIRKAAMVFTEYAALHTAKHTPLGDMKAKTNADLAKWLMDELKQKPEDEQ